MKEIFKNGRRPSSRASRAGSEGMKPERIGAGKDVRILMVILICVPVSFAAAACLISDKRAQ